MSALAYFPQIYPGELLYSVLARYHRHMGAPSPIQSTEAVFGRRLIVASIDLPGYVQALSGRLPPGFGWTADRMIDELTLLPYYTGFQPEGVSRRARIAMKSGQTDGLFVRLGMAAFRVGRVTRLRFCPECLREMQARYGETYWRRDHQLPGVLVCPEHGCPLRASGVSTTAWSRHVFVPADRMACPWNAPALMSSRNERVLAGLQRLARASRALLENPGPHRSLPQWTMHYRQRLQAAGLAYAAHRVDQQRLNEAFRRHHHEVLGLVPGLLEDGRFRGDWLAAMGRKHRKAFHPLQHVLLQDFLDHQELALHPFGEDPWPCLNPLAKHRNKATISTVRLHRNHGHLVGVFACPCGYSYTRSYFDGKGTIGPRRFQAYGPMLEPALREMITSGQSLRSTAQRLELDPKTVVKLAGALGIVTPWKRRAGYTAHVIDAAARTAKSVKEATRFTQPKKAGVRARIDWREVDQRVCRQVRQVAQQLRGKAPPVRVSLPQIERRLRNRGWLTKRAAKLPESMACVRGMVESVEQFQLRRVSWMIGEMDRADEPLQVWRVLRKSGLTGKHADLVRALLDWHFNSARRQAA